MLPGPYGARIADLNRLPMLESADGVWNDPICSPVASTDDIARTSSPQTQERGLMRSITAIALAPAGHSELKGRLAAAIGVMTTKGVVFTERLPQLGVGVHLVGGHQHDGTGMLKRS